MTRARRTTARKTTVGTIDAEVLAYTAGRDVELDRVLLVPDCIGSAAHAEMLARVRVTPRLLSRADVAALKKELATIARRAQAGTFRIRPEDQDAHLAIERALTEALGDAGRRIHTARSRNDQVAVDLRLYAKVELLDTIDEASALARVLLRLARRHARVPMVGRTHMQPAMPSSVGLWLSAHAESLLDDLVLLIGAFELNDQCPLGSAASYGVPLPIDRRYVAERLGFSRATHNVLYANNSRGKIEAIVLQALAQVMLTLSRLAQDLVLFSMPEFDYFRLPPAFGTGSSIMPQKNNPDVLELLRARAARVLSLSACVQEILRAAPSGYNRDLQETKEPLMEGFALTRAGLRILVPLLKGTSVNREALARGFSPGVFATDRALELVAGGLPFREAYNRVKASLDALAAGDPAEALARKTHWGAPAGLDFDLLEGRAKEAAGLAADERRALRAATRRLLGITWP